ncbi:MAG TPA: hypothetical protein VF641_08000 [Methylobacterium sp.]|jgi:collagen type III alpha
MRTTIALATALGLLLAGPVLAQGIAGAPPGSTSERPSTGIEGGPRSLDVDTRLPADSLGSQGNSSVTGTTPGANIGGTATSGPPGTGGAAGGPSIGNR